MKEVAKHDDKRRLFHTGWQCNKAFKLLRRRAIVIGVVERLDVCCAPFVFITTTIIITHTVCAKQRYGGLEVVLRTLVLLHHLGPGYTGHAGDVRVDERAQQQRTL